MKKFILVCFMLFAGLQFGFSQNAANGGDLSQVSETIFIPNAFTPNNDGVNDEFYIPNASFRKFNFEAFDRWGNKVYSTNNPNFRWDGTINGKPLPMGAYVYILSGETMKGREVKRSGSVSIVR